MNEKKEVDVLSKKRPTVNELKTEIIRLRKSNEKADAGLNHYKVMYEEMCEDNKKLRVENSTLRKDLNEFKCLCGDYNNLNTSLNKCNNELKAINERINNELKVIKAKTQYRAFTFIVATIIIIAFALVAILRLV